MRNWSENQIRLVFIRHGATKANKEHRYLGKTDESLSIEGAEMLRQKKERGLYPKVDYLFSSPMKRCLETARILYGEKKPMVVPEWEEMDFGAFEGKNYMELQGDARYQAWIDSNGSLPFPEGESREQFIDRCRQGFKRMLKALLEVDLRDPVTVGLVVHGGTVMALLSSYSGGEYFDYQVKNGEGYLGLLQAGPEQIKILNPQMLAKELPDSSRKEER